MSVDNSKMKKILEQLNSWCTKYYPQVQSVYDDCAGYTLQQLVYYLLGVVKENTALTVSATDKYNELYTFVNDYFDNLDVQDEVNNKINEMAKSGELEILINNSIMKKYYIFVTDSYGNFKDESGVFLIQNITNKLNIDNTRYYGSINSGGGFSNGGFLSGIQRLSIENKNTITDIVVLGGANDTEYESTVNGIVNFCEYVNANFINARIKIAHTSRSFTLNYAKDFWNSVQAYKKICNLGGIYINGSEYIMHSNTMFNTDMTHPTEKSVDIIGDYIINGLLTGECNVSDTSILTPDGSNKILMVFNDGKISISGNNVGVAYAKSYSPSKTLSTNNNSFMPLTTCYFCGISGSYQIIKCNVTITTEGSSAGTYYENGLLYCIGNTPERGMFNLVLPKSYSNVIRVVITITDTVLYC